MTISDSTPGIFRKHAEKRTSALTVKLYCVWNASLVTVNDVRGADTNDRMGNLEPSLMELMT